MAQAGTQTSINIPQLLAVALVGFFAVRWYLSRPSSPGGAPSQRRNNAIDLAKIDRIAAMFPQLDRRHIAWDLHRNGGNAAATTERVLSGRSLDVPPPTYQPILPSPVSDTPASSASTRAGKASGSQPDLITRYNLQSRVGGKGKEPEPSEEQKKSTWSSDKAARANDLKRRREEMVLAARRRMESKVAEE